MQFFPKKSLAKAHKNSLKTKTNSIAELKLAEKKETEF